MRTKGVNRVYLTLNESARVGNQKTHALLTKFVFEYFSRRAVEDMHDMRHQESDKMSAICSERPGCGVQLEVQLIHRFKQRLESRVRR